MRARQRRPDRWIPGAASRRYSQRLQPASTDFGAVEAFAAAAAKANRTPRAGGELRAGAGVCLEHAGRIVARAVTGAGHLVGRTG